MSFIPTTVEICSIHSPKTYQPSHEGTNAVHQSMSTALLHKIILKFVALLMRRRYLFQTNSPADSCFSPKRSESTKRYET